MWIGGRGSRAALHLPPQAQALVLLVILGASCRTLWHKEEEPLPVKKVDEEIVVAAWAEPSRLPPRSGQVQILVRVQKRGGAPFPGVEVRFRTSTGALYSDGKVLLTDGRGMTRDRLTAHQSALVTLNAGGTIYSFRVPKAAPKAN